MPLDDADSPYVEPDVALNELSHSVIGAAYAVYQDLGAGLDEALYERALYHGLNLRGIPFTCQVIFEVHYKGEKIGQKRIDLLVGDRLIVELKAVETLTALHKAQLLTHLKITKRKLGLLINFNSAMLKDGIKRVVNPMGT